MSAATAIRIFRDMEQVKAGFLYLKTGERFRDVFLQFTEHFLIIGTSETDPCAIWISYDRVREIRSVVLLPD